MFHLPLVFFVPIKGYGVALLGEVRRMIFRFRLPCWMDESTLSAHCKSIHRLELEILATSRIANVHLVDVFTLCKAKQQERHSAYLHMKRSATS